MDKLRGRRFTIPFSSTWLVTVYTYRHDIITIYYPRPNHNPNLKITLNDGSETLTLIDKQQKATKEGHIIYNH